MLEKKKVIFGLGLFIIIILLLVIFFEFKKESNPIINPVDISNEYLPNENLASSTPRDWDETPERKAVPMGIKVPEPNEVIPENLKTEIAVPTAAVTAGSSQSKNAQIRLYEIVAQGGKFEPSKVIVNYNDIVNIKVTAVDRDYDIVFGGYGITKQISKGESSNFEFQAYLDGRFPYYCVSCGGSVEKYQGEIIIVK